MSKRMTRVLSLILTLIMFVTVSTPAFAWGGGDLGSGWDREIGEDEIRDFDEPVVEEEEPFDYFQALDAASGTQVTVEAPMGALPTLAELRAEPVEIEDVREAVESVMAREAKILVAMDISFWMNGVEIEPEEPVNVKISAPELEGQSNLTLVHIPDAAEPETVQLIDDEDLSFALGTNEIAFKANSFSVYVVAGEEDPVPRHTYNFVDGEGNPYPFLNTAGQTVTSQIIKNGESLQEVPAPGLLNNNAFVMWVYEGGDLDGQEVKFGEPITVTEDKTFTVKAFYGNVIYVTFWQYAAGKVVLERKQLAVNEATGKATMDLSSVTVPAPSTTLKFMGWSLIPGTDASETSGDDPHGGRTLLPNGSYDFTEDTDVYPVYYSGLWIVFVSAQTGMGATYVPSFFITGDSTDASAAEPSDPTMTGYIFDGWYTEAEPVEDYAKTEAQSAHGEEFDFSTSFDDLAAYANERDEIVLYGHWRPGQTTYVVVYWKQQVGNNKNAAASAKTYDYAGQTSPIDAATGSTPTPSAAQQAADTGFQYARYQLVDVDPNDGTVTPSTGLKADGSSILNVYFDRKLITMRFSTSTNIGYTSSNWNSATTYTGLYGQTWVQAGYTGWPAPANGTSWQYFNNSNGMTGMTFLGQFVLPDTVRDTNKVEIRFRRLNNSNVTLHIIQQNANGSYPNTDTFTGAAYGGTFNVSDKFEGFYVAQYKTSANGAWQNITHTTSSDGKHTYNPNTIDVRYVSDLYIRYARESFDIKFLNPLNENSVLPDQTLLFGAALSSVKPSATEIDLGVPGYEWDGKWYKDKLCTEEFDFSTETMPMGGTKVYAGKTPIYFFIKIDPNGGELQTGQSTWRWVQYGDDSTYTYDNITRDYIEFKNDGNPAYYYYYDEFDISRRDDIWNYQYMASNPRTARYTTGEIPSGGGAQWLGTEKFSKEPDAYALIGWYDITDGTENMKPFKTGTAITRDTIIQAQWRRTGEYLVHYAIDAVNESGEPLLDDENNRVQGWDSPTDTAKYADKSDSAILDKMGGMPAGYAFKGWWYNGKMYQPGDVFQVLASVADDLKTVHIYPVLEPVETLPVEVINITFDPNGGAFTDVADTEIKAIIDAATELDGGSYKPEAVTNEDGTKTINNLKMNEAFKVLTAAAVTRGVEVNGQMVPGRGYKLKEWNTKADGTGTSFKLDYTAGIDAEDPMPNVLYAIWDEYFYIYHPATGKFQSVLKGDTTDRVAFTTGFDPKGTVNMTQFTTYYYGGFAVYAAGNAEAKDLTFENGDVKTGTIADSFWTRFKAAKKAELWNTEDTGAVYYLKEVPTSYLAKPVSFTIRDDYGKGKITNLYFLSVTDTNIYRQGGIKLNGNDTLGSFAKNFTLDRNNGKTETFTSDQLFSGLTGYLTVVSNGTTGGDFKALQAYWVTYDYVTVYGVEANLKDILIND